MTNDKRGGERDGFGFGIIAILLFDMFLPKALLLREKEKRRQGPSSFSC